MAPPLISLQESQMLVLPSEIEGKLQGIWETLSKENKVRASLFNLVVFAELSPRLDYYRHVAALLVSKFPCRILFITENMSEGDFFKTAISVVSPSQGNADFACDLIDIGVGKKSLAKVPSLILSHLLPDLPIYLLWTEDPSKEHPLFAPLSSLAKRVIFDSESSEDLESFCRRVKKYTSFEIADLNWARMEGWRSLFVSAFDAKERWEAIYEPTSLLLRYNGKKGPYFSHPQVQSLYLAAYLAAKSGQSLKTFREKKILSLEEVEVAPLNPGVIVEAVFESKGKLSISFTRDIKEPFLVATEISTPLLCTLPTHQVMGTSLTGASLIKEICREGVSRDYLATMAAIC